MSILVITILKDNFNGLVKTLESIYANGLSCSVIIKNGGQKLSGENILQISRYRSSMTIYLLETFDHGIYHAMNEALLFANKHLLLEIHDWVWFLNSGDSLKKQDKRLIIASLNERGKHQVLYGEPSYGITKGGARDISIDELSFLAGKIRLNHQALLFNTHVVKKIGPYSELFPITSDFIYLHRILKEYKFLYLDWLKIDVEPGGISERRTLSVEIEKIRYISLLFLKSGKRIYAQALKKRVQSLLKHIVKNLISINARSTF